MQSLTNALRLGKSFYSSAANTRKIVVCKNGAVASWHPDPSFPYEYSRPIDLATETTESSKSVLSPAVEAIKHKREPTNNELKEIFYTDKNEWFSRTREDRLRSVAAPLPKRK